MIPRNLETERTPVMTQNHPEWWHGHGEKMRVVEADERRLVIKGSAAELRITKWDDQYWRLRWQVTHLHQQEWGSGQVLLTTEQLEAAFNLNNLTGEFGQRLIDRFGGSSAEQGCYIRWAQYLNIPGPGTGHDGDPNISIEVTDEITEAVSRFVLIAQIPDDRPVSVE